jgi:hypothetical protein
MRQMPMRSCSTLIAPCPIWKAEILAGASTSASGAASGRHARPRDESSPTIRRLDIGNDSTRHRRCNFTYDPGFTSTASCESKITFIDGDEGVLLHRGYPIEQLAEHAATTSSRSATCCSTASCRPRRRRTISTIA